jgi:hypothetical protein
MTSRAKPKAEKKNQTNPGRLNMPVSLERTIGLREAAVLLQERAPLKAKGLNVSRLLNGLQQGKLTSGFFVGQDPMIWVVIPAAFWVGITNKQFKSIRDNSNREGAYLVTTKQFAQEYSLALIESQRGRNSSEKWVLSKLVEALGGATKEREVRLLLNASWSEYQEEMLDVAIASSALASTKKGPGAPEKGGWKLIYRVLTAHLVTNQIGSKSKAGGLKILARLVYKKAYELSEGSVEFPKEDAIIDEISRLFDLLDQMKKE